ncbi:ABC-type transporter, integral membrane subunit [Oleidesulfovibrio alaskensis G20]|uniref:ABC-type transporter, integral membrane subunit n=1 Tax=Oleidesulfovibrio alaskensis (strain ATCC BAA-1058 / DSM 17464 / G20) TaxID=207559 RepID=Q315Z5_OLEA2|nr:ABC transporter permease [Oleidesulfovibrio alaskensis]ABB37251.1 ABC-type transporter, integral membrane subunit [Oleidesulfovibrio alaskensis G20]MBG0772567.1 ABC transporter permease [Oleidesulfovibrio alaskensis]MBL3583043.1 ABC transporter permease [Oleidesulfovibrio alaskensis]
MAEFSPHTVRKLAAFRAHRRGWYSLWVLAVFFALSMCAELVANDKPLLVSYKGEWFVPVFKSYQETQFGGVLPVEADYRDPAVSEAIRGHGFMIWPPVRFSYDTVNYAAELYPAPPSAQNWLGTDDQGRDIVARVLYGFRLSILFGFGLCLVSSAVGITAGAVQGYYGGAVDLVFQRFMEIWSGMPVLYLLIILSSIVTMGFWSLLGVMLLFSWMGLVHVVRAEFLRCRQLDYVRAARAIGVRDSTIMFRHILPNAMVATISYLPFIFSGAVTTLTSLDFIGFGMPPGSPSLGELLAQGKNNLQAPWIGLTAFGVLGTLLCLLVFIGEAVRDAFDPNGGKKS